MRPWRLTRRARVEMEAALMALRRVALRPRWDSVDRAAWLLGAFVGRSTGRNLRILRARVALALRAALRADDDARCEESRAAVVACYARTGYSDEESGALEWCDALREWPAIPQPYGVPRALWEAAR